MFLGSLDKNIRNYIVHNGHAFNGLNVYVGCSGNFTAERAIRMGGQPESVHSNDVSLYSLALADAMLGRKSDISVVHDDYRWFQRFLDVDDPWLRPASIMVLLRLLQFARRKNTYEARMHDKYRDEFDTLVVASAAKLEDAKTRIDSYYSGDVYDFFKANENDPIALFFAFFPFYKGGYERLFKALNKILAWPKPNYELFDDKRRAALVDWMRSNDRLYMFVLDYPLEGVGAQLVSDVSLRRTLYLYTNIVGRTALFRRVRGDSGKRFELVSGDYCLTKDTRLHLAPIQPADLQHYKTLFLAKNIDFTTGQKAFAVLADGLVIGFLEFKLGQYDNNRWYINSDFAVEPHPHKRVSKLIVMLARCDEVRRRLELSNLRKTEGVMTTAFTRRPVSMKYRGVLDLIKRGEGFLNYAGVWSGLTAQETYDEWTKRYLK